MMSVLRYAHLFCIKCEKSWDSKGVITPLAESRGRASGGEWGKAPHIAVRRSAKGEFKNSPVDCF